MSRTVGAGGRPIPHGCAGPKIDVYFRVARGRLRYVCSTNWHTTLRAAKESVAQARGYAASDLVAEYADPPRRAKGEASP
jgi:hypothetical protein